MRAQWPTFILLVAAALYAVPPVRASPAMASDAQPGADASLFARQLDLLSRDGHGHHPHGAPLLRLNETEVLMNHSPTPASYWTIDIDIRDPDVSRYPGLMILHGLLMSLAFFIALPMGKPRDQVRSTLFQLTLPVQGLPCGL